MTRFRRISETHLYGALLAGALLCSTAGRISAGRLGLASDFLSIIGYAGCGWSWLVVRVLFRKPGSPERLWPLWLVLGMTAAGGVLHFSAGSAAALPRMLDNIVTLVSSTLLLFAMIEPLTGEYRAMPRPEQRFRQIVAGGYTAILTVGMIAVKGAPPGSWTALWAGTIQSGCCVIAIIGMVCAVRYRDRHPVPEGIKTRRRVPSDEDGEMGKRVLRLMTEEAAYAAPELKVADLAERIGEAEYKVTQCITGVLGFRNFNQMVNHFRLAEAKRRLIDPACDHLPILTIALDCGFGSIGPFNRAFKAENAVTPTEFRRSARLG